MYRPQLTPPAIFTSTLGLLEELTAISSPTGDHDGLRRAASRLAAAFAAQDLAVTVLDEPDVDGSTQPVLYARGPAADSHPLLLIGHLDTVLPARPPRRTDGRLYATGAIDMKGGLAALVGALELLAERGERPADDLLLVVVPDEEITGPHCQRAVANLGPGARGMWVLEPGARQGESETFVAGRRGMFHWRLSVHGRSAHAGNAFWAGRSALLAAADWSLAARALAVEGGPTVNVGRLLAGEAGFLDDLAAKAHLVGTPQLLNVVPDRAVVEGEARFLRHAEGERLAEEMEKMTAEVAARHQVEVELSRDETVPPLDPDGPGRPWAERAVAAAAAAGWQLVAETDRGGISFPNFLPDPGALPILDGLGPVGDGMHTPDEYVELASLDRRITLLADLLAADRAAAS